MISIEEAYEKAGGEVPAQMPVSASKNMIELGERPIEDRSGWSAPKEELSDLLELTFKKSRKFTEGKMGRFNYPSFIKKLRDNTQVMNWVNQKIMDYCCIRSYYDKMEWYDFIVPDQLQEVLDCNWISIEGDTKTLVIRKLIKND